ncbi:SLC13 family permease [Desulfurobacterium atlanticum]|uniref:Transporter, YbiR family n=1 Tax=Desulfurobacterium atlanticum TaxID=240169 RepID=A0A238ZI78_9BACT|nr:SLC13 family permease [Desulfurobacterium atlanticum]SNR83145.1 transporter, YbiR family [Desulfurobacterium atlanticum]
MGKISKIIRDEWLFFVAVTVTIVSSLAFKRMPEITKDDLKILIILFNFLVITKGLEKSGLFVKIAFYFEKGNPFLKLTLLSGILSMFVTNDIALFTVVPLTLSLSIPPEKIMFLVILETLSVNGASALTPFGNPQNIFIYYYYHLDFTNFIKAIFPFFMFSFALILGIALLWERKEIKITEKKCEEELNRKKAVIYGSFFIMFIGVIFHIFPIEISIIPPLFALFKDKTVLRKIDYFLLLTFLAFFGFTSNISSALRFSLSNPHKTLIYSAFISQIISNVPAALLLAKFTNLWKSLLMGVNVGGFGTLVGSLANLIAFKLFKNKFNNLTRKYLLTFHLMSFLLFFVSLMFSLLIT